MTTYRFVTDLRVEAPIGPVHRSIVEPERWWDDWADAVSLRRVRPGRPDGVGATFAATVSAPLGYRLSATIETVEARPPTYLRMRAEGSVEGEGVWRLDERDGGTDVRFTWSVRTTERWMNALAPVLRPAFEWSHGVVMRHAAEAAAAHLPGELTRFRSRPAPPTR